MPPPKKAFSPASRAKADKQNARLRENRAATAAPSGGAKSGKKKRKVTDLTEEKICPYQAVDQVRPRRSSKRPRSPALICSWTIQANNLESKKLGLAEEEAKFYESGHWAGLQY
jgi:hypothetical protein